MCRTCRKYETIKREFHFSSPTNFLSLLRGPFLMRSCQTTILAAAASTPKMILSKASNCLYQLASLLSLGNLSAVGWFQDCIMRRIRRSAEAVLARRSLLCRVHCQIAPSKCPSQRLEPRAKARVFFFCRPVGHHPSLSL